MCVILLGLVTMVFNEIQINELKKFMQFSLDTTLPFTHQEARGTGDEFMCCDWWCFEILRYLIEGEDKFLNSVSPYEIMNIPGVRTHFMGTAHSKIRVFDFLDKIKSDSDVLVIGEMARGLEILWACFLKDWKKIYCWDNNIHYGNLVMEYFKDKPIEFILGNTDEMGFNPISFNHTVKEGLVSYKVIDEDLILLMDNFSLGPTQLAEIISNKRLKQVIYQGRDLLNSIILI